MRNFRFHIIIFRMQIVDFFSQPVSVSSSTCNINTVIHIHMISNRTFYRVYLLTAVSASVCVCLLRRSDVVFYALAQMNESIFEKKNEKKEKRRSRINNLATNAFHTQNYTNGC